MYGKRPPCTLRKMCERDEMFSKFIFVETVLGFVKLICFKWSYSYKADLHSIIVLIAV